MDQNKPWLNEPDELYWKEKGLQCIMRRNVVKAWCGYVEIPKGHPYYDLDYHCINDQDGLPDIHGGLTFTGQVSLKSKNIECRVVGFDCAHACDLSPGIEIMKSSQNDLLIKIKMELDQLLEGTDYIKPTYKDKEFVKKEITKLVDHIVEVGKI